MPPDIAPRPTLSEVKASIGRELGMRKGFYQKPSCRLSTAEKAHELACMEEAYRLLDIVGKLRARINASDIVNDLAVMVKQGGMPTDPFVVRNALGAGHHAPAIAVIITNEIMAALK